MEECVKFPTGITGLDSLLGGGLEPQILTQFYGEAGSGKSTLALAIAVNVLKNGKGVIFIDTEGFSVERFCQIAGKATEDCASRLYLFEAETFAAQGERILECSNLMRTRDIGLIILDSATALYRLERLDPKEALSVLANQMMKLQGIARRFNVPVIITNQVFMDVERGKLSGLGGTSLSHISNVIVRFEKYEGFRRAVLVRHRSQPEGKYWYFTITGEGVADKELVTRKVL